MILVGFALREPDFTSKPITHGTAKMERDVTVLNPVRKRSDLTLQRSSQRFTDRLMHIANQT